MEIDHTRFESNDIEVRINPGRFLNRRDEAYYRRSKESYLRSFPSGFFESFVSQGVIPFLRQRGYQCCVFEKTLVQNVKQWAWSYWYAMLHPMSSDVRQAIYYHDGTDDELTWFRSTVTDADIYQFAEHWHQVFFLDDSDCGQRQLTDLSNFLWSHIHLDMSHAMQEYRNYLPYVDSDEEGANDGEPWMDQRKHKSDLY